MPTRPIDLDQEPIWEIQFDETVTQYRAFCIYRDLLDGRTLSKVATAWARDPEASQDKKHGGSMTTLQQWSARNRWVERAEAYEIHLERKMREERETEIMRMRRTELQLARGLMAGAMRRTFGFDDNDDPTKNVEAIDWNKITAGELAILARLGVEVGRLATNQPTSLVKAALMVTNTELTQISADITQMAMRHIPEERKPLFAEEIRAYAQGERRMLTEG